MSYLLEALLDDKRLTIQNDRKYVYGYSVILC